MRYRFYREVKEIQIGFNDYQKRGMIDGTRVFADFETGYDRSWD